MTTPLQIRPLRPEDRDAWQPLWDGYLRFYRHELAPEVTDATFERLCAQRDGMFGLVAVGDVDTGEAGLRGGGAPHALDGFVHAVVHPSTWSRTSYCYLEDLFVAPEARGSGAGERLIEATAAAAQERGSERLYWQTQQFNAPARSLYDGVAQLTSFVVYERPLR
jgi:GNAT superfamily N-acetyltransferase